jgi:hypothetical protein
VAIDASRRCFWVVLRIAWQTHWSTLVGRAVGAALFARPAATYYVWLD